MFLFGHILTAKNSNLIGRLDVAKGEGVVALMLPDILSSHDWAYNKSWNIDPNKEGALLIQAHIIGDAVIHFGKEWDKPLVKRGWAYKNMKYIAGDYYNFFNKAKRMDYIKPNKIINDSIRGWSHTMVEYTIDQYLTDNFILEESFDNIKKVFSETTHNLSFLSDSVVDYGIETSKPFPDQPLRYSNIIKNSNSPDEFHLRGLAAKYGLKENDDVIDWLRSYLRSIISLVGINSIKDIINTLKEVTSDPYNYNYPVKDKI
ncbi:hypothetical protein [Oceanobacillus sp. 1P07AA]|uniref:hypothetical protein n=1 Tax=Oceanobacillus sp. 1P07AA TaxID=3132293 RepID=UPI0039A5BCE7